MMSEKIIDHAASCQVVVVDYKDLQFQDFEINALIRLFKENGHDLNKINHHLSHLKTADLEKQEELFKRLYRDIKDGDKILEYTVDKGIVYFLTIKQDLFEIVRLQSTFEPEPVPTTFYPLLGRFGDGSKPTVIKTDELPAKAVYHVTGYDIEPEDFCPRIPSWTRSRYKEDDTTERIDAYMSLSASFGSGFAEMAFMHDFNIFKFTPKTVVRPSKEQLPTGYLTGELWITKENNTPDEYVPIRIGRMVTVSLCMDPIECLMGKRDKRTVKSILLLDEEMAVTDDLIIEAGTWELTWSINKDIIYLSGATRLRKGIDALKAFKNV